MGGKGGTVPGRRITIGAPKSPSNVTGTFFNTVHLLPTDLRFEYGGAKLASCLGRHLTSLRPCLYGTTFRNNSKNTISCAFLQTNTSPYCSSYEISESAQSPERTVRPSVSRFDIFA